MTCDSRRASLTALCSPVGDVDVRVRRRDPNPCWSTRLAWGLAAVAAAGLVFGLSSGPDLVAQAMSVPRESAASSAFGQHQTVLPVVASLNAPVDFTRAGIGSSAGKDPSSVQLVPAGSRQEKGAVPKRVSAAKFAGEVSEKIAAGTNAAVKSSAEGKLDRPQPRFGSWSRAGGMAGIAPATRTGGQALSRPEPMLAPWTPRTSVFSAPLDELNMTSPFGYRSNPLTGEAGELHTGQDFGAGCATPVKAAAGGTVSFSSWHSGGGGNRIVLEHGYGIQTTYNHLADINVQSGQKVARGDTIGRVGSTGASTGCHLHFEVTLHGKTVDPVRWL